jgi:hypothetical protein
MVRSMTAQQSATAFDFAAPAELFPCRAQKGRRPTSYKRFSSAAEAVLFAIEEMPPPLLPGTYLEVEEARFDSAAIRGLYERADFTLPRTIDDKSAHAAGGERA